MFDILKSIIGYHTTGTTGNIDTYIGYACIAFALILGTVIIDNVFSLFRSLIPKSHRD